MSLRKHIPNTITSMNLLSGVLGVIFTLEGHLEWAFPLMLLAAVFDFCDGLAARLLQAYSPVGKELDSLSDLVSFGVLPALMLYKVQPEDAAFLLRIIPVVIAVASALRLAKFNIDERQTLDFIGLPTPSCAMICGSLSTLLYLGGGVSSPSDALWLDVLSLFLSWLLISEIPMFGMKIKKGHKLLDSKRIAFLVVAVAAILCTPLLHWNWSAALLAVFSFYVVENLVLALINSCRREA